MIFIHQSEIADRMTVFVPDRVKEKRKIRIVNTWRTRPADYFQTQSIIVFFKKQVNPFVNFTLIGPKYF